MPNSQKDTPSSSSSHTKKVRKEKPGAAKNYNEKSLGAKTSAKDLTRDIESHQVEIRKQEDVLENYITNIPKELGIFPSHVSQKRKPGESLSAVLTQAIELIRLIEALMKTPSSSHTQHSPQAYFEDLQSNIQEEIQKFENILTPDAMGILETSHKNIFTPNSKPSEFILALQGYKAKIDVILAHNMDYFQIPKINESPITTPLSGADAFLKAVETFRAKMDELISGTARFLMIHRIVPPETKLDLGSSNPPGPRTPDAQTPEDSLEQIANYDSEKSARTLWQAFTSAKPQTSIEERHLKLDSMLKTVNELTSQHLADLDKHKKHLEGLVVKLMEAKKRAIKFIEEERYNLKLKEISDYNSEKLAKNEWARFLKNNPDISPADKIYHLEQILETTDQLTRERLSFVNENQKQYKPEDVVELTITLDLRQKEVVSFIEQERNRVNSETNMAPKFR